LAFGRVEVLSFCCMKFRAIVLFPRFCCLLQVGKPLNEFAMSWLEGLARQGDNGRDAVEHPEAERYADDDRTERPSGR